MILSDVKEDCPAWKSGARPGDAIVTVKDWLVTLMDRPQVGDPLDILMTSLDFLMTSLDVLVTFGWHL